jgi:hypothetical protein
VNSEVKEAKNKVRGKTIKIARYRSQTYNLTTLFTLSALPFNLSPFTFDP